MHFLQYGKLPDEGVSLKTFIITEIWNELSLDVKSLQNTCETWNYIIDYDGSIMPCINTLYWKS